MPMNKPTCCSKEMREVGELNKTMMMTVSYVGNKETHDIVRPETVIVTLYQCDTCKRIELQ